MQLESGQALYRVGDSPDCLYIILSGRLRSVICRGGGGGGQHSPGTATSADEAERESVGEFGRGDLVGLVEVSVRRARSTTVMAVRDSEIAKMPSALLDLMKVQYPRIVARLIHFLGHGVIGGWQRAQAGQMVESQMSPASSQQNLATVALVPASERVPLDAFAIELEQAVGQLRSVVRLTSTHVQRTLGASALERLNEYK